MIEFLKEFTIFMLERKKYWLMPVIIGLLFAGILIGFTQSHVIAPFIYTLF